MFLCQDRCIIPAMGLFGSSSSSSKKGETNDVQPTPEPAPARPSRPPEPQAEKPQKDGYGIDQLVQLMRRLPSDNIELVVRVLKETLESVKIAVPRLIKEAEKRASDLTSGISDHRRAITKLEEELAAKQKSIEEEIAAKKKAIEELEAAHQEVSVVKERLNLGLRLDAPSVTGVPKPAPTPASAPTPPLSSDSEGWPAPTGASPRAEAADAGGDQGLPSPGTGDAQDHADRREEPLGEEAQLSPKDPGLPSVDPARHAAGLSPRAPARSRGALHRP